MRKALALLLFILVSALPLNAQAQVTGTGTISGVGQITVVPLPTATASPTSLGFGNVTQGQSSASQAVTLQNTGTTQLTIVSAVTTLPYSATTTCGATLAAGNSCVYNVVFSPTGTGSFPGTLTINDNSTTTPHVISLAGSGVPPAQPGASLTPASFNFGNQTTGTTSASQPFTLQNTGGAALSISSITASASFSQTNNCPASLGAGASCLINVTFSPSTTGLIQGSLSVVDNAAGSPQSASLSGTGIPPSSGGGVPATAGWFSIPNTAWASLCPNATGARPDVQGNSGCGAVVDAWAGGYLDTKRHRLCFTGGGHHDYYGNEIYCLNLDTLTIATQNVASNASTLNTNTNSYDTMPDGTPGARHTYGGLAYYPDIDSAIFMGGGPPNPGGTVSTTWAIDQSKLNPATTMGVQPSGAAKNMNPTVSGGTLDGQFGNCSVYDPNTQKMLLWEPWQSQPGNLWNYDQSTNTYTHLATFGSGSVFMDGNQSCALDPVHEVLYAIGNGKLLHVSVASGSSFTVTDSFSRSGCNTAQTSSGYPGVSFDQRDGGIVVWNGGNSITVYSPASDTCSTETYSGGPTTKGSAGTFGRWQYDNVLGVHVVCNENSENCFTLRRNVDVAAVNGFSNRVAGINTPGGSASIVSWQNFDSYPVTNKQQYFQTNIASQLTTDWTQPNTDGGALHFAFKNGDFQAGPGWFNYNFCAALNCLYGQGSEFYVQYKERISAAALSRSSWDSGFTDWKMAILREGDSNTQQATNCSSTPTDIVLDSDAGHIASAVMPWVYVNCGNAGTLNFLNSPFQPIQYPLASGATDLLDQPASGGPHYGSGVNGSTVPVTDPTAWNFTANEWFTIQAHVKIGTWDTASSVIEMWACHQAQPCRLVTNASDAALNDLGGSVTDKFGAIVLLPYATGATWLTNVDYWYDDLIVSNRRIPDPDVSTPNAPDSLSLSAISSSSITVNWRVNSNNGTAQDDTGFLVERCTGTVAVCMPNPQSGFTQIGTTAAHASSFVDNTVSAGHTYTYRVRAKNANGNSAYTVAICFNGGTTCGGTAQI
jgi:hypothetical protein